MRSYDLKNLAFTVNSLIVFLLLFHMFCSWLVTGVHQDSRAFSIWVGLNLTTYLINYFLVAPRVFKNGFSGKKFLLLLIGFIICYLILSYFLDTWSYTWMTKRDEIEFGFTQGVTRLQTGFFYFLFSTGVRVIKMLETNQITIQDLEVERKKIELGNLQTSIGSDLVSKYIYYLQEKNKDTSVSREIVELADFLRYSTYRNEEESSSFQSELKELNRFKEVAF